MAVTRETGGQDGVARRSGYRRTDMPLPAEPHPPAASLAAAGGPLDGRRLERIRRRPRTRTAAALIATLGGIALLGAGIVQTTGGLTASAIVSPGPGSSGVHGSPAPSPGSSGVADSAAPSPAGSPHASAPATPAPSPSPLASPGPVAGPNTAEQRAKARAVALQATLDRMRAKLAIPGASVTILFRDGTTWTGVSGLADVATLTPVKPTTAFAFASMSKTFTSALILQLVADGRLRLTDSAATLLPPLKKPIDGRITIAMLLDHTSGLHDYFLNPKIDKPLQADPSRAWSTDDALRYVGKSYFPPGRGWHYSNTNYLLLGLIAERVTGQPLGAAIRASLLEPSRLDTIWYQAAEKPRASLAHGYRLPGVKLTVKPVDLADGSGIAPFRSVVTAAAGAGSMAGTSGDLARWARLLYSGEVLGPSGTAALLGGFSATAAYHPSVAYGYGVQAAVIDGHVSFGHSGRLLGFRGVVRHFPVDGVTIAVLTNQSRADPGAVLRALLAIAAPPPAPCPICRTAS
jgi:D-alanyl-D-alanine carboxypeptidase